MKEFINGWLHFHGMHSCFIYIYLINFPSFETRFNYDMRVTSIKIIIAVPSRDGKNPGFSKKNQPSGFYCFFFLSILEHILYQINNTLFFLFQLYLKKITADLINHDVQNPTFFSQKFKLLKAYLISILHSH